MTATTNGLVSFIGADGTVAACVFVHDAIGDIAEDLEKFLNAVADDVLDQGALPQLTAFHDPARLAARYVGWLTNGYITSDAASIAPRAAIAGFDREYSVRCHAAASLDRPAVS
jgi:hypothetical protein